MAAWVPSAIRKAAFPGGSRSDAVATPIQSGVLARLVTGVKFALSGKEAQEYFGPGQPLPPQGQEAQGRQFDYPFAVNTNYPPRGDTGSTIATFPAAVRALADGCDLVRLAIETRKDQMGKLAWVVKPKDIDAESDDRCQMLMDFLSSPDKEHDWATWLRMLLEELLVIDAPVVYPRMTRGQGVYSLDLIDGATLKRIIDNSGRTPVAPAPAYQQIIKGLPSIDYTRDELLYNPRNPRVNQLYGYSPVEQIITTINISGFVQVQLHWEGCSTTRKCSAPDLMIACPVDWNPDQIKMMQEYFDGLLSGNTAERRRTRFIPGGMEPHDVKAGALKDEYDEWLARVVCYCFSLPLTVAFYIKQMNRATAESSQDVALEEGLAPLMQWVEGLMNQIITRWFKMPDLCFGWKADDELDPLTAAQIAQIYVTAKVVTPDEVREDLGREPLTPEQQELLNPPPPPTVLGGGTHDENGNPVAPKALPPGAGAPAAKIEKLKKKHFPHSAVTAKASRSREKSYVQYFDWPRSSPSGAKPPWMLRSPLARHPRKTTIGRIRLPMA